MSSCTRADLYQALAEALSDPPPWMAGPGCDWPLFESAARLAPQSEAARRAIQVMAEVRAESVTARRKRYTALFAGPGRPCFWLYESAFLNGRILGRETFAVEQLYRAARMEIASAELPDHASLELAFLAHLAAVGEDSILSYERQFIEQHAGRWLPELGRALAHSGDEVYAPIGQLLADRLAEAARLRRAHAPATSLRLPIIPQAEACTLCGFCVQVCPTRSLAAQETKSETVLLLSAAACIGCGKCERICETHALKMKPLPEGSETSKEWSLLRQSPCAVCRACGQPTISRAELDFVAAQIGRPAWLEYCLNCRPQLVENAQ